MPELPEVETTINGLHILKNKKVIKVKVYTKKLRYNIPNYIHKTITGQRIKAINRIAKYILIKFKNNTTIIIHLGMSGRLKIVNKNFIKEKHDHLMLYFIDNYVLALNDTRKFSFVDVVETENIYNKKYISSLGIDALSNKLSVDYIYGKIHKSIVPIKQILLNQQIVAGIGNIYASEILFDAKISPLTLGRDLLADQINEIIKSIKKILKKAIRYKGSSIRDYRSSDGTLGNFQSNFKVYGKAGKKISSYEIIKIIQYGRTTYFCPKIQKEQNSN